MMTEVHTLKEALVRMTRAFKPFTMKPIGGEGSAARMDQQEQIEAHKQALVALGQGPARWRHRVRGTTYRVLYEAAYSSSIVAALDGMTMVVYIAEADGRVWVRPALEFFDGRFEPLAPETGS